MKKQIEDLKKRKLIWLLSGLYSSIEECNNIFQKCSKLLICQNFAITISFVVILILKAKDNNISFHCSKI